MSRLNPAQLGALAPRLVEWALERAPEEACGLVVMVGGELEVVPLDNLLSCTPEALTRFRLDPLELVAVEEAGAEVVAVFHSHPTGSSEMSPEDRRQAAGPDGFPLWPALDWIVVAVSAEGASSIGCHRWDGRAYAAYLHATLPRGMGPP